MRIDYSTYFKRLDCSSDLTEFNASEIIELYQDLISESECIHREECTETEDISSTA